jgi:hypothetical protein
MPLGLVDFFEDHAAHSADNASACCKTFCTAGVLQIGRIAILAQQPLHQARFFGARAI